MGGRGPCAEWLRLWDSVRQHRGILSSRQGSQPRTCNRPGGCRIRTTRSTAAPFAGLLPAIAGGVPGNILSIDESAFGLLTPAGVVGPATPVPPPITSPTLHDNIDSYDSAIFDGNGDGFFDIDHYFTIYPDEAAAVGALPSDIFVAPTGAPGATLLYAIGPMMGLLTSQDSVDALIMFDNNLTPSTGAGAVEPGVGGNR